MTIKLSIELPEDIAQKVHIGAASLHLSPESFASMVLTQGMIDNEQLLSSVFSAIQENEPITIVSNSKSNLALAHDLSTKGILSYVYPHEEKLILFLTQPKSVEGLDEIDESEISPDIRECALALKNPDEQVRRQAIEVLAQFNRGS
jgi:plasmid stability protein